MSNELKLMKKANNHIDTFADSSFTIPVAMGPDTLCTLHFTRHIMSLQEDDKTGVFNGGISLDKEIVASITLTRAHAEELSDIIQQQLKLFDESNSKKS